MDAFELTNSLFTPASDLVTGSIATNEAVFGRAGNDTLRIYTPGATNLQSQNLDFLFGDLFDNSEQEIEQIFAIADGSDPLSILNSGPPSVGADKFILGDRNVAYYDDPDVNITGSTTINEIFGLNDYAVITDFNPQQDTIQLNGSPEDYFLVEIDNLNVESVSEPFFGEAIFLVRDFQIDLVGYIISTPEVDLSLADDYFEFVDNTPRPTQGRVGQLGTPGVDLSFGSATDNEGNVYLTGGTSGSLGGKNQGGTDVWVAKFDRQGNNLWTRQFGSGESETAYGIVTDNDGNFYLSGQTNGNLFTAEKSSSSDAWVAKFDENGDRIWGRQVGTETTGGFSNGSFDLDVDDAGNVYISGLAIKDSFVPPEVFNFPIQDDSFVIKFDSNGNQQWYTEFSSPFFEESYGMTVDGEGNVYVTGWTQGLVRESDPGRNLLKYDYWLAKLDTTDGSKIFTQQFNSSNNGLDFANDVETDSQGNAYVIGWTTGNLEGEIQGSYDAWLAKYNPNGEREWIEQFGTGGDDGYYFAGFDIDSNDNIYLTGYTDSNLGGNNQGSYDSWVVKYNSDGDRLWNQQLGSTDLDYGTDVAVNDFGDVFVTGFTNGSLGARNVGAEDVWVARLNANNSGVRRFEDDILKRGESGLERAENAPEEVEVFSDNPVTESLREIFAPEEPNAFIEAFGEALRENSEVLTFEDETGEELEEQEVEEIEGIEDDDEEEGEEDDDEEEEEDDDDD